MHRNEDKYMLRLPDGWRAAIKARAVKNHRSMNNEILAALEGVVTAAGGDLGGRAPATVQAGYSENQHGAHDHAAE